VHRERERVLARDPDAVLLANGRATPPAALDHIVATVRSWSASDGCTGSSGHQLLCRQSGLRPKAPVRHQAQPSGQGSDEQKRSRDHQPEEPRVCGALARWRRPIGPRRAGPAGTPIRRGPRTTSISRTNTVEGLRLLDVATARPSSTTPRRTRPQRGAGRVRPFRR